MASPDVHQVNADYENRKSLLSLATANVFFEMRDLIPMGKRRDPMARRQTAVPLHVPTELTPGNESMI